VHFSLIKIRHLVATILTIFLKIDQILCSLHCQGKFYILLNRKNSIKLIYQENVAQIKKSLQITAKLVLNCIFFGGGSIRETLVPLIPRLHDQANIEKTSSRHRANIKQA